LGDNGVAGSLDFFDLSGDGAAAFDAAGFDDSDMSGDDQFLRSMIVKTGKQTNY
jgi:hypothetical protein